MTWSGSMISMSCAVSIIAGGDDRRALDLQMHALAALAMQAERERLEVEDDVGDILAHAGDRRELVQHAVDLNRRDRGALQRRQQHATQRVAQRDAEAALERLGDDRRLAVRPSRPAATSSFCGLIKLLPVLLDHGATRLAWAVVERRTRLRGRIAPPEPRDLHEPRRCAPIRRGDACAAGSHCAGSASRRGSSVMVKPHGLQGPQRRFAARARAPNLDLERAHAVLHGLAAGVLGGDLRGDTGSICAIP